MNTRRACPALWRAIAAVFPDSGGRLTPLPAHRQEDVPDGTRFEVKLKSLSVIEAQEATHEDVDRAGLQPRRNPPGALQGLGDPMLHMVR